VSTTRLAVPPGRAGRLWLVRRLAVARRAAGLLDRKLQVLVAELERLRAAAEQTGADWDAACRDAERWLLRAVLLGGERAVRLAGDVAGADVTVTYAVTMGARHPAGAECRVGRAEGWEGAAVAMARQAHQVALTAAVRHAAAAAAVAVIEAETTATRYRLRAVRDRWIPRLSEALAEVEFSLEELERADTARLRRSRHGPGTNRAEPA
jgi:V/A-type H+/Na+-transporting ATPase subunit D